jgi:hypothetical protein
MATRLVCDELDLNFSALASGLIVIIIIVVGGGWSSPLDATIDFADRVAISDRMFVERRRALVVLICDVGHCNNCRGMTRVTLLSCVPMTLLLKVSGEVVCCFVAETWSRKTGWGLA